MSQERQRTIPRGVAFAVRLGDPLRGESRSWRVRQVVGDGDGPIWWYDDERVRAVAKCAELNAEAAR